MRKRSERSLLFAALIFVFACLLLSGGQRLIGHEGTELPVQMTDVSAIRTALSAAPAPPGEMGLEPIQRAEIIRSEKTDAPGCTPLAARVVCDANGNVLGSVSYLHAVYQAFSLGDGFV